MKTFRIHNSDIEDIEVVNGKIKYFCDVLLGQFNCIHKELTSLENFPKIIKSFCNVSKNLLTDLKGSLEECKSLNVGRNNLTTLKGNIKHVNALYANNNNLTEINIPFRIDSICHLNDNKLSGKIKLKYKINLLNLINNDIIDFKHDANFIKNLHVDQSDIGFFCLMFKKTEEYFYPELFKYILENDLDLNEIKKYIPKEELERNIAKSMKNSNKFNL